MRPRACKSPSLVSRSSQSTQTVDAPSPRSTSTALPLFSSTNIFAGWPPKTKRQISEVERFPKSDDFTCSSAMHSLVPLLKAVSGVCNVVSDHLDRWSDTSRPNHPSLQPAQTSSNDMGSFAAIWIPLEFVSDRKDSEWLREVSWGSIRSSGFWPWTPP